MLHETSLLASRQDGTYPRPQLVRAQWRDLSGQWSFAFDDEDAGLVEGWMHDVGAFPLTITVPFPPESAASGIGDPSHHRVLWYRRPVTAADVAATGHAAGRTLVLHFGAVDYRADVWIGGQHIQRHEGGHTPFAVEVPYTGGDIDIVVRVEDDPQDLAQPRGKQDWEARRHVVWYDRTSGIWQPVWLESLPRQHLTHLAWRPSLAGATVQLEVELSERPVSDTVLHVTLRKGDETLATQVLSLIEPRQTMEFSLPALRNGQSHDDYLWSPERPTLIDATIELQTAGQDADAVQSYLGLRDVAEADGRFLLNGRPYAVQGILSQGYWPGSHLAAPNADALRAEVQLIKELGFTTARVHQKIEDPRFMYWADRLGLLLWTEMPSTYEFSVTGTSRLVTEWIDVLRRDSSHPSIVVWVPFNESWGVQQVATSAQQRAAVRALYELTRAIDDSRLVISNDGWEHTRSDLLTIHDYENDPARLHDAYSTPEATRRNLEGFAPNSRQMLVGTPEEVLATSEKPVILSEFGGVSVEPPGNDAWGYRVVETTEHFQEHLAALFDAAHASEGLAGWCYTQLTDTAQETNGLVDENRTPKLPIELIRAIVMGEYRPRNAEPVFGQPRDAGAGSSSNSVSRSLMAVPPIDTDLGEGAQ
jgi:beta-galactosidase/beta-glucuronidase